ncbi:MAG: phosphatidate cytidylyltransferase [Eubacteriales bacterium]|jgi:phosphatidate cytidylyltransferase|nr:phosphatidate cytidylyltransferase [Clostridiales bacterium]
MRTRIITAIIALGVFIPFLIFSGTPAMLVFASAMNIVAVCELFACVANGRSESGQDNSDYVDSPRKFWTRLLSLNPFALVPSVIFAGVMPIIARYSLGINFFRNIFVLFFTYMFTILSVAVFMNRTYPVADAAFEIVMTLYISYGFTSLVLLRDMPYGEYVYLLAFLVPWMSDAGAYFVGCKIGKHKLNPAVSPKKTVEGAIGGVVFGAVSAIVYGLIVQHVFSLRPQYGWLAFAGFVISALSQCGDLVASLIKRHYNIKDYGNIFPGHGGVLDRFDSVIAAAPFLYILCLMLDRLTLFA